MQPFKIFTPTPMLGYSYDVEQFWNTIDTERPVAIIVDGGSTDPGPYMLGSGKTIVSRQSYINDLEPILEACHEQKIKLLVSSAGGAGTNAQVDILIDILREISEKRGYLFVVSTIKFYEDRAAISANLLAEKIQACGPGPQLQEEDIVKAEAIVAQMGAEPFLKALENPAVDIIISGRSYDPAPFAAFSIHNGVQPNTAWHMGKIVECGGLCAQPKGRSMVATMHENFFDLTPTDSRQRCTPLSVAAHTLYEKSRPDRLPGPGGVLHLDEASYEQLPDNRTIRVTGSKFVPTPVYQIKLEGAEKVGFRSTFIGGIRDPILIRNIDTFLEETVRNTTKMSFPQLDTLGGPRLIFHVYGKNAVMGSLEPSTSTAHEIGVLGEIVAGTQEEADAIAGLARIFVLHLAYPDQLATAGNLASPLTPLEQSLGPVYKFSLHHLMDIDDPLKFFPIETVSVGLQGPKKDQKISTRPAPKAKDEIDAIYPQGRTHDLNKTHLTIADVAAVVRSKNAGPYEITLDILFDDPKAYHHVRDSNILGQDVIKKLYRLIDSDVSVCMFFEPALGWKCTFKRPESQPQGSVGERDTFGAQLHAPLLGIKVPALD